MTPDAQLRAEPETVRALELADFLLIAEAVLGDPGQAHRRGVQPSPGGLGTPRSSGLLRR